MGYVLQYRAQHTVGYVLFNTVLSIRWVTYFSTCSAYGGLRTSVPCSAYGGLRTSVPCSAYGGLRTSVPCSAYGGLRTSVPCSAYGGLRTSVRAQHTVGYVLQYRAQHTVGYVLFSTVLSIRWVTYLSTCSTICRCNSKIVRLSTHAQLLATQDSATSLMTIGNFFSFNYVYSGAQIEYMVDDGLAGCSGSRTKVPT